MSNKLLVRLAVGVVTAVPVLTTTPGHAGGLAIAPCDPTSSTPVDACTIDYGGTTYKISTTSSSYFFIAFPPELPNRSDYMFWWGNSGESLAAAIAAGRALGIPNNGFGPLFAYASMATDQYSYCDFNANNCTSNSSIGFQGVWAASEAYVPPASSVPGPLPALGAAAAFGYSRKLRNRIKKSGNSASSTFTL